MLCIATHVRFWHYEQFATRKLLRHKEREKAGSDRRLSDSPWHESLTSISILKSRDDSRAPVEAYLKWLARKRDERPLDGIVLTEHPPVRHPERLPGT